MYSIDDIYRVDFFHGHYTYVVLSYDIPLAEVRYKSLLAADNEPSIGLDVLKRSDHVFICKKGDAKYREVLEEMNNNKHTHLHIWSLWDAQGHYNSDAFLKKNNSIVN